jgi:hypothetical protein
MIYKRPAGPKECKMRTVSCLGLCWIMTLGLVAVSLGQQPLPMQPGSGPPAGVVPEPNPNMPQPNAAIGRNNYAGAVELPAPAGSRGQLTITGNNQIGQPPMNDGQPRGELGVWMAASGGAGVQVQRVTPGSAAERAGLRVGDVILQVNGRGATSPQGAAQLVRQVPIGQSGTLTIWRDGDQQQLQFTIQPARETTREMVSDAPRQAGFGAAENSASGDLASRTIRLEQQINSLTQELATLRQELSQLRTAGPVQTGFNADATQSAPPQNVESRYNEAQKAVTSPPTQPTAPPPGFGPTAEKKAATPPPAAPAPTTPAPAAPAPAAPAPSTPAPAAPAPAADKSSNDLFGSDSAQPKTQDKPKTEDKKADDKGASDDLFK